MTSENLVEIIDLTENIKQPETASETEILTTVIPHGAVGTNTSETEAVATNETGIETEIQAATTCTSKPSTEAGIQAQITEAADQSSAASGLEIEAEIVECATEEPLTPAVSEISDVSKSATNSGRVTPASQSDVASISSSEKSTPTRKRRSADLTGRQIEFDNISSSSGSVKGTKLPNRVGIHWRKGERLEAKDFMDKWFPAKIREVNEEDMEVLIHFDGWNQRYDEWLPMTTERIRPMTRHSARKDENRKARTEFKIGERVLAKWTDCKMYEAKVTAVFPNGTVEVIFYDGFKKLVQPINLRPMPSELNTRASDMKLPPSEAPKKAKLKPGSIGSRKERLSTDGLKKSEDSKPKSKPKDQRHRTKMLVSGSMFARPSTSKSDNPQLTRAMTPVVKLGIAVTEADYAATTETKTFDTEIPGTSQLTPEPSSSTSDSFITAPSVLPVPKKAFVIESDHNQYKCPFENCGKGFRKESLLDYHIKYYHVNGGEPPPPAPPKKRRKTISIPSADSEQATSSGKKPAPKKQRHVSEGGVRPAKKKRHISEQSETVKKSQPMTEGVGTLPVEEEKIVGKTVGEMTEEVYEESMDTLGYLEGEEVTSPTSPDFVYEEESGIVSEDIKPELKTEAPKAEPRSGSKHRRSESQDTNVTEESTDAEDYLKPDELVNCICGFYEENGLMIQCEVCMCWQHASCFGITDRTLPKVYVCYVCENPPGVRESSRYTHEQDWFKNGELAAFNYLSTPVPTEERLGSVKATHSLVADVSQLNAVLHALKLQLKILRTKDEKQLKQWHMDWDMVEFLDESLETNQSTESTEGNLKEDKGGDSNVQGEGGEGDDSGNPVDETNKPGKSSEVKPETDDDIIDGNIKSFDKSAKSTSNASESKTEEKDQNIKRENEEKDSEVTRDTQTTDRNSSVNGTLSVNGEAGPSSAETTTEETKVPDPSESSTINGPERGTGDKVESTVVQIPSIVSMVTDEDPNYSDSTESALVDEDPIETCERNLIQHILRIQGEISKRMDLIEEQINVLESMESKYTGIVDQGLEPDLVHLKKNIKNMDYDLTKVKRMTAIQ